MILEFLIILATCLAASLILALANSAIRSRIALRRYKKHIKNIPFTGNEDLSFFGNHLFKFSMKSNCQRIHERHQKLGDTFAAMINERRAIATTDLDLIKQVIIDEASVNMNRINFKMPMKEYEKDSILFAEDEQWRRIRKSFAAALKPRYFKTPNVINEIQTTIDKLIGSIERHLNRQEEAIGERSQEFDVDNLMHRFSMNVVLSCFYKQYNIVNFNLSEKCNWVDMVDLGLSEVQNNPFIILGLIVPTIRRIVDFIVYHLHPIGRWRREIMHFLKMQARIGLEARKQLVELRKQNKGIAIDESNFLLKDGTEFNRNIIDYIVDQLNAGELSKDEFLNSSAFLFAAASKTSADSLAFTLQQISLNQSIQEKLRQSIREHGIESEYLAWTINESLRLHPPVPGGPARTLKRAIKLKGGDTIEAGTFLLPSLYTIHRLPKYWGEDAKEFKPERWAKADQFHPAQFMPFGAGLRRCLGKDFALFEMKMALCALLERYKFTCDKNQNETGFDAPLLMFMLNHSPIFLNISRL